MPKCYILDIELNDDTRSDEHIIPNALGGHLKSSNLISKEININLFSELDSNLCNKIELSKLIDFKRDRKSAPQIKVKSLSGNYYLLDNKGKTEMQPFKPISITDESGNKKTKFNALHKKSIFNSFKKKLSSKEYLELIETYEEKFEIVPETLTFPNGLSLLNDSEDFRGVAKIATNYAVYNHLSKTIFEKTIKFICGNNNTHEIQLGYYYPKEELKYEFGENEISNILFLRGDPKERILYCYIELFNTHCFIVNLSYDYDGPDISKNYIWDLINGNELNKNIELNLTYNFLSSRNYMFYENVNLDYNARLERIAKIQKWKIKKL